MSVRLGCLLALLLGGLLPWLAVSWRGGADDRLVALEGATAVLVPVLTLFAMVAPGQSYELILPLVLVPLSFAGTLVFTRLLPPDPETGGGE